MTDLDTDLSNRLSRLAAAVPTVRGQLDPVHRSAVTVRQSVRLAWITPLVVIVVAIVGVSALNGPVSQPTPGATPSPGPSATSAAAERQPPVAVDRDGDFELILRAGKPLYAPNEPIDVSASLTYRGTPGSVEISTDSGGPIMFGIRERVYGEIRLGGLSLLTCKRSTLTRDEPVVAPFKKSGSFDGEHPQADQFRAFFEDPQLRLPEGTWHLYAVSGGPCLGTEPQFQLNTEIEIVVDDDPTATPGHPSATDWADKPVYGGDDIGNMVFQVKSQHPTYEAGSPVQLDTYYWFSEGPSLAEQPFVQEVAFSIVQVDPAAVEIRSIEPDPGCAKTRLTPGEERHVALDDGNVVLIKASSWPASSADALKRGVLDLPIGRWRITAVVTAHFGPCGAPDETWQVHASVEVDVVPST